MVKTSKPSVAIFGGSFDPPHQGHQKIVQKAVKELNVDKLLIVPAYLNPFKTSTLATPDQRLEWCHMIFDNIPKVSVESHEIDQNRSVKTSETVKHFSTHYDVKYLIIGADNLSDLKEWHMFDWLNAQVTWVIFSRAGYLIDTEILRSWKQIEIDFPVSSTQIRKSHIVDYVDNRIKEDVKQTLQNQSKDNFS